MATEYLNNRTFENIINTFQTSKKTKHKYELIVEDLDDAYKRKSKRNANKPEDSKTLKSKNRVLRTSILSFEESQDALATAFYTLSENIARYAKFSFIAPDDAIQEGVLICFEKIDRFDPSKGKAFNYMTTCILNHYRQLYRSARNYNELKKRYQNFMNFQSDNKPMKKAKFIE